MKKTKSKVQQVALTSVSERRDGKKEGQAGGTGKQRRLGLMSLGIAVMG